MWCSFRRSAAQEHRCQLTSDPCTMDLHLQANPQLHYGINGGAARSSRPGVSVRKTIDVHQYLTGDLLSTELFNKLSLSVCFDQTRVGDSPKICVFFNGVWWPRLTTHLILIYTFSVTVIYYSFIYFFTKIEFLHTENIFRHRGKLVTIDTQNNWF